MIHLHGTCSSSSSASIPSDFLQQILNGVKVLKDDDIIHTIEYLQSINTREHKGKSC